LARKHRKDKKIERTPTKRQLSKWEKQKKQSKIIIISTVIIIILLAGVIGVGVYLDQVTPYQKAVIKVNDTVFSYDYYIKMLDTLTRGQRDQNVLKYYVDLAAGVIQEGEVLKEKAADMGITATSEEIEKELESAKLPRSDVNIDLARTRIITQKYMKQNCFPKQPKSVEQAEVQAMFLENSLMAKERKQRLLMGDNFSTMAGTLSIESTTQSKKGYLGWIPKGYESYAMGSLKDSAIKDVIFKMKPGEISDPVYDDNISKPFGYWVLEITEKDDTKGVHARGILLGSKEEAEKVRADLLNGADWAEMARKYSQDSSGKNGGDLGWKVPGMEKGMLDRILAALEVNKLSDVIRDDSVTTKGGYWVIQVLKLEDRPLDQNISQTLADECLGEWVQGLMKDAKIENLLDQSQKDLAVQKIIRSRSK